MWLVQPHTWLVCSTRGFVKSIWHTMHIQSSPNPCRHKYKNNILLLIILLFQTNHTAVQNHSIPALLYTFRCRKPQCLMHAEQSENFWQKSEQEVLVSETGLWENRRYCCGVRRGDDDDDDDYTSLVNETVLWENRRYCCGVRRGNDDDDGDTSLVSETVLLENRRYCCGVRRGDNDVMMMVMVYKLGNHIMKSTC